jgi:hypothetical protein
MSKTVSSPEPSLVLAKLPSGFYTRQNPALRPPTLFNRKKANDHAILQAGQVTFACDFFLTKELRQSNKLAVVRFTKG